MAVTYYVALPFIRTEDGTAPGEAQESQSEAAAIPAGEIPAGLAAALPDPLRLCPRCIQKVLPPTASHNSA